MSIISRKEVRGKRYAARSGPRGKRYAVSGMVKGERDKLASPLVRKLEASVFGSLIGNR